MSQQALTIAVSPTGLPKLFNALIVSGNAFASGLDSQSLEDQNLNIGQIPDSNISKYVLQLQTGTLSKASATMNSVTQVGTQSDQFILQFSVNTSASFNNWIEAYDRTTTFRGVTVTSPYGPYNCGQFSFSATGISLTATVQISQNNQNVWEFTYVTSSSDASSAQFNFSYPEGSVLTQYNNSCDSSTIQGSIENALEDISYDSAIQATITPILNSLNESGQLTTAIDFNWTPNTFVFPNTANSLQSGVTGTVTYNGGAFPPGSLTPPNLALPPVVTTSDVQFYAADFLFSSLYWAYFEAGQLSQTIIPSMLPEPAMLNTKNFQSSIPDLYNKYPNDTMQVVVAQSAAPIITFVQAYQLQPPYLLSPQGMFALATTLPAADYTALKNNVEGTAYTSLSTFQSALQTALGNDYNTYGQSIITQSTTPTVNLGSQLPTDVYNALLNLAGTTYETQSDYVSALQSALGSGPAQQYQAIILSASICIVANLAHTPTLTFNVLSDGNYDEVFAIQIQETDVLTNFQLGTSGTTQTIQSLYQVQGSPTATLISSNIADVNADTLANLWQYVLAGVYASIMQAVASTGVPLPFIEGYTFQNSAVSLQPGYADVIANIQFNS